MFGLQLAKFEEKAEESLETARREILLRIFRGIVYDTPVLTGRLRGEWQLAKGSPPTTNNGIDGRTAGHKTMQHIEQGIKDSKFGDTMYLVNLMPYAYPIEFYGHSSVKAPQGMVRRNVSRLNKVAKAVARGVNNGSISD